MDKNKSYDKFIESGGENEPNYEKSWFNGYNSCKEEVLRIIFLNTKVNGIHKVDIEKVIEEIEKL